MIELVIIWVIFFNLAAVSLFQIDKIAARQKRWRVADKYFLSVAMLGGSLGSLMGMKMMRNKTRRRDFKIRLQIILCLHIIILLFVALPTSFRDTLIDIAANGSVGSYLKEHLPS